MNCTACNVGGIDRIARIIVGLVLLGLTGSSLIGVWGWIGAVPLATGLFRFCPLYTMLGIRTNASCATTNDNKPSE
jgi:hypothetical protein